MTQFPRIKTACFDIESNGLLQWGEWYKWDARFGTPRPPMDKIHVLVIRDYERKINYIFRHNEFENTIEQGLEMLEDADLVVGMNIIHFDIPAFSLVFNDVNFRGKIFDTLPMVRMIFANQKDKDFRLAERKLLPGGLIGSNSLESWGIRLGLHKGDYVKECEALGIDPWGEWSQEMEDYCVLDVAVTVLLYERCLASNWAPEAIEMEHCIHDLMGQQERNGIPFDVDGARLLENSLRHEAGLLQTELVDHFGKWWAPEKKIVVKQQWEYPDGFDAPVKKYGTPNPLHGESYDRAIWGEVTVPKRDRNVKSKEFPGTTVRYSTEAPYCKIELKEFNPGSRVQIIDRLSLVYNWHPVDFTEKGNPEVNDDVLRKLVEEIPMAEKLAELFYYEKRLGQVADGKNGWLRKVDPDGFIHHYCNVGGTISGRASHIGPNLGQVPRVAFVPLLDDNGLPVFNDKGKPKMRIGKGREGDHGWDCRNLFYVPNPWIMVGCDLSGIELRCFGEQLAKYDGGEYLDLVLRGDIHTYNQHLAGLKTRDLAKTFIYACVPMDTQALTKEGWKTYEQLRVGELILTYNADKKVQEWQPLLEKVYYADAEVIELKNDQTFSVRCTPNHRWFTTRRSSTKSKNGGSVRSWKHEVCEAQNLTTEHNIIVNAPLFDEYETRDFQSHSLPKYGTDWSTEIMRMGTNEMRAWLLGFCLADGYWMKTETWTWCQNKGPIADAALLASYLVWDTRVVLNDRTTTPSPMTVGRQTNKNYITCQRMQKVKQPNQPVWCVRTTNESWVMKQGNTITITGNTIYGAGDVKLGSIASPLGSEDDQRAIGKELRARFMGGLPAFAKVVHDIQKQARQGWLPGLDGRRLFVRSKHAALNTKLQSDAALIAKKWNLITEHMLTQPEDFPEAYRDLGLEQIRFTNGWKGDLVQLLWIHDEIQQATLGDPEHIKAVTIKAANLAGLHFGYTCPIDAEGKYGHTWAETH